MKWLMIYVTAAITLFNSSAIANSAITYPLVNGTEFCNFYFLGMTAEPSSRGPSCTECRGASCESVCTSSINNPKRCQCVLPAETATNPPGRQWINNITLGEYQTFTITYEAFENATGSRVGTIAITVNADYYQAPDLTNGDDNSIFFNVFYFDTSPNNSDYSGPCWSIGIAAL